MNYFATDGSMGYVELDQDRTMQLISPRSVQHWATSYKERAQRLMREEKMAEPGYASIQRSKETGLWNFMDDVDALIQPPDLKQAFDQYPGSANHFNTFPASVQRFTLRWIKLAKTEATRKRRILKAAQLAQRNERIPGV